MLIAPELINPMKNLPRRHVLVGTGLLLVLCITTTLVIRAWTEADEEQARVSRLRAAVDRVGTPEGVDLALVSSPDERSELQDREWATQVSLRHVDLVNSFADYFAEVPEKRDVDQVPARDDLFTLVHAVVAANGARRPDLYFNEMARRQTRLHEALRADPALLAANGRPPEDEESAVLADFMTKIADGFYQPQTFLRVGGPEHAVHEIYELGASDLPAGRPPEFRTTSSIGLIRGLSQSVWPMMTSARSMRHVHQAHGSVLVSEFVFFVEPAARPEAGARPLVLITYFDPEAERWSVHAMATFPERDWDNQTPLSLYL